MHALAPALGSVRFTARHVAAGLVIALVTLAPPLGSSAAAQLAAPTFRESAWRGGILFDEDARDALLLRAPADQELAATLSDVFLATTFLDAAAVDSVAVPLAQQDGMLAWRASGGHLLGVGLTLLLGEIVKGAAGRARPFERVCRESPSDPRCRSRDTFASFYSLHAGVAFASAGTSCALHESRALYGDALADAVSCAASVVLAAATGLLRVASDRHYLSDVIVGAVLGFVVGYVMPLLVVPERGAPVASSLGLGSVGVSFSRPF